MKSIAERLNQKVNQSAEFSRHNFGLQHGDDFPQFARELLADETVSGGMFAEWLLLAIGSSSVAKRFDKCLKPSELVHVEPAITELQLRYLYWGIQIGREMQQEQDQALSKLASVNE